MSLTATYADDLARVRLAITGAPAGTDYAVVERSLDEITWSVIRGGNTVPIDAGTGHIDDYEFTPGVLNHYRASYVDSAPITFVAAADMSIGTGSLAPALPAAADGDLLLLLAAVREPGAPDTPDGWDRLVDAGPCVLFGRIQQPGDTAPTVTFTEADNGTTRVAQVAAFHNAQLTPAAASTRRNDPYPAITCPGLTITADGTLNVFFGVIASAFFSYTTPTGHVTIGDGGSGDGSSADSGMHATWNYTVQAPNEATDLLPSDLGVIAYFEATSHAGTVAFTPASTIGSDQAALTPRLSTIWIKNPQRPYLNRTVTVTDFSDVTRPARAGVFEVISRRAPVAVTDVQGSRRYTLTVTTPGLDAAADLDAVLASGEPVLVQVPDGCPVPGMYAVVGDTKQSRHSMRTRRRFFTLPLTEVAAPDPTIVGETVLWVDIVASFATWADLVGDEPTWTDVVDRIGSPTDIITE